MGGSSGGSGGSGAGGGTNFPSRVVDCRTLRIDTVLLSPSVERLKGVAVGDLLPVLTIVQENVTIVGIVDSNGDPIGYVSSADLGRLLRCIAEGHSYVAEVQRIEGAECRVRISHANV